MPLTDSQQKAVAARGNVIVVAGAGTGKTSTLIERCLDVVCAGSSLDRVLMVTFTETAAAEMRHRLRLKLLQLAGDPPEPSKGEFFTEQLAMVETAQISTIHSLCLRLVKAHFHELGLDPEVKVLDDQQCRLLMSQTLDVLMEECYSGRSFLSESVRSLIAAYAPDRDSVVRELVLKLHISTQSLPDSTSWIQRQQAIWAADAPAAWEEWLLSEFTVWRRAWLPVIEPHQGVKNIDECLAAMTRSTEVSRSKVSEVAGAVAQAGSSAWPRGTAGKVRDPLKDFFQEAAFLASVSSGDTLESDWQSVRGHMAALLSLSAEFAKRFTSAKSEVGGVDFPDLEQLTLRLLLNSDGKPSDVARGWQSRMDYVFVDECQDINGAQDAILTALSRSGAGSNRFLVGDVKQSIYQFRLADPDIFRRYEEDWCRSKTCHRIALTENFRSRPGVLEFINSLFFGLMRSSFGGVAYEPLQAGQGSRIVDMIEGPCVELHFIRKVSAQELGAIDDNEGAIADSSTAEREAWLAATRMREFKESGFIIWDKEKECRRPAEWRDMAVLMRSPGPRTEAYAKVFHQAGIPLAAPRGGFLEALEVSDMVSLLQMLDNPLQDIPLLAVLRSPLVGLTVDELAMVRAHCGVRPFWSALREFASEKNGELGNRLTIFLQQFGKWRELVRQVGPSLCLERVLADTSYELLLSTNERGVEQMANVRRLLDLARQFDPYLRQGLFRFLKFIKALEEAEESPAPAPAVARDAVQLMSIHKSKGLEFPIVALAGLGTRFNLQELNGLVLLDSEFGLAPKAMTALEGGRYPTLPFWLAERHQRSQRLGEELRLLYVAATRARDRLICIGTITRKEQHRWESLPGSLVSGRDLLTAGSPMDWFMAWLPALTLEEQWKDDARGASDLMTWELWDPADERLSALSSIDTRGGGKDAPIAANSTDVSAVSSRLSKAYEHQAATIESAKSSVSALRRRGAELLDEETVNRFGGVRIRTQLSAKRGRFSASERGTLHHRFLEHMDIEGDLDAASLTGQAQVLVRGGVFSETEAAALELDVIAAFWASKVGRHIFAESHRVRRELPFTARFEDVEVRSLLGQEAVPSLAGEFVVIQGVVDLAVVQEHEIWLLDFKTDDVKGERLMERAKKYEPQLRLYAAALERIHRRPVRHRWLHFLGAGQTLEFNEACSAWND